MFIRKSEFKKRLWQAEHNGYLKGLETADRAQSLGDVMHQLSLSPGINEAYFKTPIYRDEFADWPPMPSSFRKFIEEEL